MPAGVESMFSAKETPWHKIGNVTEGALTSSEAIEKAGLDWTVSIRGLATFQEDNNTDVSSLIDVPDHYATVRDTDNTVLGVVGNRYTPIQNIECFDFLDTVLDDSEAKYETAGSLYGGKIVWMLINLGKDVVVGEDRTVPYLLLTNSHDGSTAIKGMTTPIRVVCANTLSLALKDNVTSFGFRHTNNVHNKITQARKLLEINYKYIDNFQEEVEKLIEQHVERDDYFKILDETFPMVYKMNERDNRNARTKSASYHLAMTCIAAGYDKKQTEELAVASSKIFLTLMNDVPEVVKKRYSAEQYVENTMNLYNYLLSESIFAETDAKELFEI
jgi:phage/plasmid-like protein (TIGR03299 family)